MTTLVEAPAAAGRILVVDDERQMGMICALALTADGHHVETTTSPKTALELLRDHQFDLLLTDILMPDLNGLELALRARRDHPALGVLVMTADASYEHMLAALGQGVADFLSKPFRMEQLRLTVNRALHRQRLLHENLRLQTLVAMLEASQSLSSSLDPRQIATTMIQALHHTLGVTCAHVSLSQGDSLVDSGAVHEGECLLPRALHEHESMITLLRVPLRAAEEVVGEVVLVVPEGISTTSEVSAVVQMIANHGATALHNAWLYRALAELDRQKSEFISLASQELRTPLSVILGYSFMLQRQLAGRHNDYITQVVDAGLRINDVVDDLLTLHELDIGEMRLAFGEVVLQDLVDAAVNGLRAQAEARNVRLRLMRSRRAVRVRVDRDKLIIATANLVANALRFTPEGGTVTVICGQQPPGQGGQVVIAVHDTGIGIPAEHIDRIFGKFDPVAESPARAPGGLGVGLAIARGFAELHGGTLQVQSKPDRGSLYLLTVPSHLVVSTIAPALADQVQAESSVQYGA